MKITISKRYMKLPVTPEMQPKRLLFKKEERIIADVITNVDPRQPCYWYYWDMREFSGLTLEMEWDPHIDYIPEFTDHVPTDGIYQERYRPTAHFSASRGWINDPNGLVYYEGQYHMFFQHNPAAPVWGNMHWGHAVSTDLLHWKENEIALFPDDFGTMFSGSAIVDKENVTGLKTGDHDPLLLYYTAAGNSSVTSQGKKFTQCMAYSVDGGHTFKKYGKNPVVPHIAGDNRDPKVIYVPEESTYYMALYLDGNEYALLTSNNLLDWTISQKLILPEDAECPDFYPLTTASGKKYWIFSGASDRYLVGTLENHQFRPVQEPHSLQVRGKSYAAQTFSNIPGSRILRMGWNQSIIPNSSFNCSMCTPAEMTLRESSDGLWLCINPVKQYAALAIQPQTATLPVPLFGCAQDITLELLAQGSSEITLSLLGLDLRISSAEQFLHVKKLTLPLFGEDGHIRLRIVTDIHSTEIYAADGQAFTCVDHIADENLNTLSLTVNGDDVQILKAQVSPLKNIWK